MNKVFISGNLTRDPEVRYTQSGKAVARMGIAVRRAYRSKSADNSQPEADFFNLQAWEKTAEFCKNYLSKGSRVLVEGRMQTYSYEGQDGIKRNGIDIVVENIEFAGSKRDSGGDFEGRQDYGNNSNSRSNSNKNYEDDFSGEDISDDDVPF